MNKNCGLCSSKRIAFSLLRQPFRKIINTFVKYFANMTTLENLHFDNLVLRRLPIDPEKRNYVRGVNGACFSKVKPTPVKNPTTVAYSPSAMMLLDLSLSELQRKDFAEYFSGNKLLPGSDPAAHCYCGHQFGYFSGQLGDGAAMYLGEVVNRKNERWEIQLKGAGPTPYSRTADGRKVMRSTIREFLCSEAMHFLGVPTTRAGVCITSNTEVIRDIFYDGHPIEEKCTIVLRIAPSFLRFGSFEIFKTLDPITGRTGPSVGRNDILISLLDYTIETFYPEIQEAHKDNSLEKYGEFFKQVVLCTARLVAEWQCVGFCHGVLNTDNMSILGVTIDYGPFGFMDMYNPDHICNASDDGGRYSYIKQPKICFWNLQKLAEAIEKALPLSLSATLLELYEPEFKSHYLKKMRQKLGLIKRELPEDSELIENLFKTMTNCGADFTNTFRSMSISDLPGLATHESSFIALKQKLVKQCYPLKDLIKTVKAGMDSGNLQMFLALAKSSPAFAERLEASGVDLNNAVSKMEKLKSLEKMTPESKKKQDEALWSNWLEIYKCRLEKEIDKEMNEDALQNFQNERVKLMNNTNPRFILRNYIAQDAITKAEDGDYSEVRHILQQLEKPYDEVSELESVNKHATTSVQSADMDDRDSATTSGSSQRTHVEQIEEFDKLPPEWASKLKVT